eukprot:gene2109-5155_t
MITTKDNFDSNLQVCAMFDDSCKDLLTPPAASTKTSLSRQVNHNHNRFLQNDTSLIQKQTPRATTTSTSNNLFKAAPYILYITQTLVVAIVVLLLLPPLSPTTHPHAYMKIQLDGHRCVCRSVPR